MEFRVCTTDDLVFMNDDAKTFDGSVIAQEVMDDLDPRGIHVLMALGVVGDDRVLCRVTAKINDVNEPYEVWLSPKVSHFNALLKPGEFLDQFKGLAQDKAVQ